jgi:hypothetical protein
VIEFFDFGERDVDLRLAAGAPRVDQLRQAVQGLRAEHQVHVRRACDNRCAFLACHAAADADQHMGMVAFVLPDAAEVVKHLLLRFFAHRAGVEQNHIGFGRVLRLLQAMRGAQHVRHLVRVVLVHLAAEGLDVDFRQANTLIAGDYFFSLSRRACSSRRRT